MNAPAHGPILLIEDNPDDVLLMQRAFRKLNLQNPLEVIEDGEAAVSYLSEVVNGGHGGEAPALVLLDLKLPRRSGLEVLEWLRAQPRLRRCPVVVLTSSKEAPDVRTAYDLGANSYLIKPVEFQSFLDMVGTLNLYWLVLNQPADDQIRKK
jgi:CheY-like chemotaxis protein